MQSRVFTASTLSLLLTTALLSGCGMGTAAPGGGVEGATISGRIIGGQNPVVGATIQLYEVLGAGYGKASHPLLSPVVMSGPGGGFNITNLYNCLSTSDQVYIVATGGDPGLGTGTNGAIALMAALGPCSALPAVPNINVNEVTTVAAVWALAPFMTSFDHVGTSSTNMTGLANAFGMANNLVSFISGNSPGAAPAGATIPTAEIYSLGNSLAACVNSAGGVAGNNNPCGLLFTAATPPVSNPTAPTDTIGAALNIALYPGSHVGDVFNVGAGVGAPFQTALSQAPNDWTIAANFVVGTRQTSGIAFDASGDLWVDAADGLYELSPAGSLLNTFSMAGNAVSIDPAGNIWVGASGQSLLELPSTLGSPVAHTVLLGGQSNITGLAMDGNGNAWYSCNSCSSVYEFNPTTSSSTGFVATGVTQASNVSIDPSEHVWLGAFDNNFEVNAFNNNGTQLNNSPFSCGTCGYAGFVANDYSGNAWIVGRNVTLLTPAGTYTNIDGAGGLFSPSGVAIDGAGNAWVTNTVSTVPAPGGGTEQGSLSEFSNAGAAVTSSNGYVSDTLESPQSVAVDGSGNVWLRNSGTSSVTVFVGAGVPVVTPLSLGVKNGTLGTEPGNPPSAGGPGGAVTGVKTGDSE
jgi:streptogramin lyase